MKNIISLFALVFVFFTSDDNRDFSTRIYFENSGASALFEDNTQIATVSLGIFSTGWVLESQDESKVNPPIIGDRSCIYSGSIVISNQDSQLFYTQSVKIIDTDTLDFIYDMEFRLSTQSIDINSLQISIMLPTSIFKEVDLSLNGYENSVKLPKIPNNATIFSGATDGFSVKVSEEKEIIFTYDDVRKFIVNDLRFWGIDFFEIRFIIKEASKVYNSERYHIGMRMKVAPEVKVFFEPEEVKTDTSKWVPFTPIWNKGPDKSSAVNMSKLLDPPAGKYGFLRSEKGSFVFEKNPGKPVKFWGVNLSASANFPDYQEAEVIAERLAALGINIVRHHHMDNPRIPRSLIAYGETSQEINFENLDRLDYLIAQLKKRGIYSYIDLLVFRQARVGDKVENWDKLPYGWKGYAMIDDRLIELQKDYATKLLTHVNPYTGLSYSDDPAIALIEIINESDLITDPISIEPYKSKFESMWQNWLIEHKLPPNTSKDSQAFRQFVFEVESEYYEEMITHLRSLGVRVPITGSNQSSSLPLLAANARLDFTDSHAYWDHPKANYTKFTNSSMTLKNPLYGGTIYNVLSFFNVPERPFFCSEWDHPWPNFYRAEGVIWMASMACLQGWDGVALYSYRHNFGPIDYISGFFDTAVDPTYYALMPIASLIFHREDIKENPKKALVHISRPFEQNISWNARAYSSATPVYHTLTWIEGIEGIPVPEDFQEAIVVDPNDLVLPLDAEESSDSLGQVVHKWRDGLVLINTERVQGAIGFLSEHLLSLKDITIKIDTDFAVVIVIGLDNLPIAYSNHLLIAAVSQAENTNQVFHRSVFWELINKGLAPILIKPVTGRVLLPQREGKYRGWALDAVGIRSSQISIVGNQVNIGYPNPISVWYEIQYEKQLPKDDDILLYDEDFELYPTSDNGSDLEERLDDTESNDVLIWDNNNIQVDNTIYEVDDIYEVNISLESNSGKNEKLYNEDSIGCSCSLVD